MWRPRGCVFQMDVTASARAQSGNALYVLRIKVSKEKRERT